MRNAHTLVRPGLACAAVAAAALFPAAASATGVAAGTTIENTATATYLNGAVAETVTSNQVDILVDEVLDVTVASLDAGNVTLGADGAVLSFQITNTGNGPEAFDLTVDPALAGDDFDPSVTQIAYDSNGNNVYDAGVDTVIPVGGSTPLIDADATLRIFVVTALAGSPDDGDTADVGLAAAATTGTGTPGTVYAGLGVGGGNAVVGLSTAEDDDLATLIASIGAVTLTKSATIADSFGGTEAIPGAIVTYEIDATANGTGSISGLTVTDSIPGGTTYVSNSLELDGGSLSDADDADAGEADGTQITVDVGTLASGTTRTITFSVTIN